MKKLNIRKLSNRAEVYYRGSLVASFSEKTIIFSNVHNELYNDVLIAIYDFLGGDSVSDDMKREIIENYYTITYRNLYLLNSEHENIVIKINGKEFVYDFDDSKDEDYICIEHNEDTNRFTLKDSNGLPLYHFSTYKRNRKELELYGVTF